MSKFRPSEQAKFESLLNMKSGYVLEFSDPTFDAFFAGLLGVDIHSEKYCRFGSSKANKLRSFWTQEDDHTVGKVLQELIEMSALDEDNLPSEALYNECFAIAERLQENEGASLLHPLRKASAPFDSNYITKQIERMESSIESDPSLAIGTAKELIETCCKSILNELGKEISDSIDISSLTKQTLKELHLVPDAVDDASRGKKAVTRILQNLGQIGNNIAELRNLYGTGHGKSHTAKGLQPRHAKLAIGSAATLVTFLFETHQYRKNQSA